MKIKFQMVDTDGSIYHEGEAKTVAALKFTFSENAEIQKIKLADIKEKNICIKREDGTSVMIYR